MRYDGILINPATACHTRTRPLHSSLHLHSGEDQDLEIDVLGASGILVFQGEEYGWMNVTEVKGANKFALENYFRANEDHLLVEKGHPKVMVPLIQLRREYRSRRCWPFGQLTC